MSAATDTFAAFLGVLADGLDDDVTGDGLASRLYLSRYHLDRMISAVAGEPPAAFRRRILLERAAYRLLTTERTILDVAIEAGYGSHEAFTRAFARAFGRAPGEWRRRPGGVRIEAPNDIHFQPPGSLRLPASTRFTSMAVLNKMVEHHVWLLGEMVKRAERLSDEQLDRPIEISVDEDEQTLRSLLSRLVGQMDMWNSAIASRDYDWSIEKHESVASLQRRLTSVGPVFLANVRSAIEDGRLDDTFVDALCEPAEVFTYGGMIAHVLTFAAHRRTLVVLALDAAGITDLGWGDPMRWVAESAA
jgi:AraC-like DNA-binding protein